jgi:hypothetical protein
MYSRYGSTTLNNIFQQSLLTLSSECRHVNAVQRIPRVDGAAGLEEKYPENGSEVSPRCLLQGAV